MSFELLVVADTNYSLLFSRHYQQTAKLLRDEYHLKEIVILSSFCFIYLPQSLTGGNSCYFANSLIEFILNCGILLAKLGKKWVGNEECIMNTL